MDRNALVAVLSIMGIVLMVYLVLSMPTPAITGDAVAGLSTAKLCTPGKSVLAAQYHRAVLIDECEAAQRGMDVISSQPSLIRNSFS